MRIRSTLVLACLWLLGCSSEADEPNYFANPPDGSDGSTDDTATGDAGVDASSEDGSPEDAKDAKDVSVEPTDTATPCPPGVTCVTTFPFSDDRDTSVEPAGVLDGYACAPNIDETGPEVVYRVTVPSDGFLSAAVYENDGVDVDVHILSVLDASACVDRGDRDARADVTSGDWWVVVDTYSSGGVPKVGGFRVDIGFVEPSRGPCVMEVGEMPRVGDDGNPLSMPATGPVVMEAHLVTQEEPAPYPATATDELGDHYGLSQSRTGFVMHREENWAPLEGGSFYGCGIGSPDDFPVLHEAWYVNMYWTAAARPPKGTRMILREPGGSRAVVVAAGYETGPGDLSNIAGTAEESHHYLGTGHESVLTLGIAEDQSLAFGPRVCD